MRWQWKGPDGVLAVLLPLMAAVAIEAWSHAQDGWSAGRLRNAVIIALLYVVSVWVLLRRLRTKAP
jgi:hypothetical protein